MMLLYSYPNPPLLHSTVSFILSLALVSSLFSIPPTPLYARLGTATSIEENNSASLGKIGGTYPDIDYVYRGLCAQKSGKHEYHIKIYALSNDLNAVIEKGMSLSYLVLALTYFVLYSV